MLKPAIGQLSEKTARDIETGSFVPDGQGYVHQVVRVFCVSGQIIQLVLSDGQVMNLRPATRLYCLTLNQ